MPKTTKTMKTTTIKNEEKTIQPKNNTEEITMEKLFSLVTELKNENEALKQDLQTMKQHETTLDKSSISSGSQLDFIEALTKSFVNANNSSTKEAKNLRSNREVTIVHNSELHGDLATVLSLSTSEIVFHRLGEERTISWEQFEELCGKYRGFLEDGIVMVTPEYEYLCNSYKIKCFNAGSTKIKLTSEILSKLPNMTNDELTNTFNSLAEVDQKVLLNYWLMQCYNRPDKRDIKFYDRYKLELLNHLSNSGVFNNILTDMNNQ